MTRKEMEPYWKTLVGLKKRLGGDLSDLEQEGLRGTGGEASGSLSNIPIHPADLANDNYEEEVTLSLLENESQLMADVIDALHRIEQGTFGRCQECGREIAPARLKTLPYARHCMECAQALQQSTAR